MKPPLLLSLVTLTAASAVAADVNSFADAFAQGKASLHARLRFERAEQTALRDSDGLTLRTRLGYTTAAWRGWKFSAEAENITAADADAYNQAGLNPGGAGRAVIADPEGTEINQAWAAYTSGKTTATLGRQRLVLDNHRFVGDVGWRQNQQTFDAFSVQDKTLEQTTFTYAYVWQVNRVFGDKHAQGDFESASHFAHASYAGFKAGTLAAYAYRLDFDNSAANSCTTFGASFAGATPLTEAVKLAYRAEFATQSDYGSSTLNYTTDYVALELGLTGKPGALTFGYENLGSDNGVSFRTPLATLHAFNGWADLFLTTPANGLRNTYVKAVANLPEGFGFTGFYHWFKADRLGADYGTELDLMLSRKFGKAVTAAVKYARFDRELLTLPDVTKFWLQLEFAY